MKPRVLVADDNPDVRTALRLLIESEDMDFTEASTPAQAQECCRRNAYDVVLLDLNYALDTTSGAEGLALITSLAALDECPPLVVMTGWSTVEIAVEAMKRGASDFITKPWDNERLLHTLAAQVRLARSRASESRLRTENRLLREELHAPLGFGLVAESPRMQELIARIEQIGRSAMNVLFTGENGTGKSLLAEHLHRTSPRSAESFIAVNMGAITETLFESEMFGHVKGAFTDAHSARIGRFELADRGTIFLDEIGNLSAAQQAKLLRVIEQRAFEKVGSSKTQSVDVRIVAATNADLGKAVEEGRFRQDLLYRLNTMTVHIPPLRERGADIAPLARWFVARHAEKYGVSRPAIAADAIAALERHGWPGNVRELGHVMERALFLGNGRQIGVADLHGLPGVGTPDAPAASAAQALPTLDEAERLLLEARLAQFNGNAVAAARSLGLSRSAFYRRLEKHALGFKYG
jgi:DNA-binding NtrC family response regulator